MTDGRGGAEGQGNEDNAAGDHSDGFLKSASNALRASLGLRTTLLELWWTGGGAGAASRATVTRGSNNWHWLVLSLIGIRSGIGFKTWKRVEGSKWPHCLQQWSAAPHLGHAPV